MTTATKRPSVTAQRDALLEHLAEMHGLVDGAMASAFARMPACVYLRLQAEQERSLRVIAAALGLEPETLRRRR